MQCVQNRKLVTSERRLTNVHPSMSHHEPAFKTDYVRKITADAFMVGSLPTPQSSRVLSGIIRSTESNNCTYTTNSGFGGMRIYPYSDYKASDFTVELRCSRPPSKHPAHCCACASTASTVLYTVQAQAPTPRQSNSVAPVARQHSQVHVRQTSVGAITDTASGVVLRQHSHQYNPHPHSHHHLSRRDRALMATSMLMNPQHPYHMQDHHAIIPVYHPHLYRQSMPPVVGLSHQRFQVVPPVYAALHIL